MVLKSTLVYVNQMIGRIGLGWVKQVHILTATLAIYDVWRQEEIKDMGRLRVRHSGVADWVEPPLRLP
jgi:hypothetical protein